MISSKFIVQILLHGIQFRLNFIILHHFQHLDSRLQCRHRSEILCSGLELFWSIRIGSSGKLHTGNHLTSSHVRRHCVEPFPLSVKYPDTSGGIHLMSRKCIEITVNLPYVHTPVDYSLGTVNEDRHVVIMTNSDNILDRIHYSENI